MGDGSFANGASGAVINSTDGSLCFECCDSGPVEGGACGKRIVSLTGLPGCAAEAEGDHVLCEIEQGSPFGYSAEVPTYVSCTPNFVIKYSPGGFVGTTSVESYVSVTGRSTLLPKYTGDDGLLHSPGLVFQASGDNVVLDSSTGVVTILQADEIDGTTVKFDGCSIYASY